MHFTTQHEEDGKPARGGAKYCMISRHTYLMAICYVTMDEVASLIQAKIKLYQKYTTLRCGFAQRRQKKNKSAGFLEYSDSIANSKNVQIRNIMISLKCLAH